MGNLGAAGQALGDRVEHMSSGLRLPCGASVLRLAFLASVQHMRCPQEVAWGIEIPWRGIAGNQMHPLA